MTVTGYPPLISVDQQLVEHNTRAGFWRTETLSDTIRLNAARMPQGLAFREGDHLLSWSLYDELSDCLAGDLIAAGLPRGARIAVMLPDGPGVHVAFTAGEKAGLTIVGIGARAGDKEIEHLLRKCGATALMTEEVHAGRPMHELVALMRSKGLPIAAHIVVDRMGRGPGTGGRPLDVIAERRLGPNDLWLLNSTSGTTGLPKCVMQFQNRWWYFHQLALDTGALSADDKFLGLVPAPFGFGLWTAHFTPCLLGAPTILVSRFDADQTLDIIEQQRPTVISCVSTQFSASPLPTRRRSAVSLGRITPSELPTWTTLSFGMAMLRKVITEIITVDDPCSQTRRRSASKAVAMRGGLDGNGSGIQSALFAKGTA